MKGGKQCKSKSHFPNKQRLFIQNQDTPASKHQAWNKYAPFPAQFREKNTIGSRMFYPKQLLKLLKCVFAIVRSRTWSDLIVVYICALQQTPLKVISSTLFSFDARLKMSTHKKMWGMRSLCNPRLPFIFIVVYHAALVAPTGPFTISKPQYKESDQFNVIQKAASCYGFF